MDVNGIKANMPIEFKASSSSERPNKISLEQQPDTIEFKGNHCSENMTSQKTNFSITEPQYSYTGAINGKDAYIETNQKGLLNPIKTINGKIGDAEISYSQEYTQKLPVVKTMTGNYNGKSFELNFKPAFFMLFGTSTIEGKIDGKEVSFKFPGSAIPEDTDSKDILSSILMIEGYKPVCSGNEFKSLTFSDWKQKENNDAAMAMAMSQPAYMPTWHYDTVGMPGGAPMYY